MVVEVETDRGRPTGSEVSPNDVRVYEGGTNEDEKPYEQRSRFTNVWVLEDGVWQCVSGHSSVLELKP